MRIPLSLVLIIMLLFVGGCDSTPQLVVKLSSPQDGSTVPAQSLVLLWGSGVFFQQEVRDARKGQIGDPADQVQPLIHPLDLNPGWAARKIFHVIFAGLING